MSKSESEYSPGSTSVQVLFPTRIVLLEEPASSLLCGFALAFDRHAKSLASNFDAYSSSCNSCEGGGDVAHVVTPLVGGVAQAFHDDRVVELRVQLGVEDVEGKDREEQVEAESEKRVKEMRPCI